MRKFLIVLLTFSLGLSFLTCGKQDTDNKTTIAVIPKGTTLNYWQSVHAGAVKASKELDVEINWIGPVREDARQEQIAIVDNQVVNQIDGIVLAPLDAMALRRPVVNAVNKDVPIVIIDSELEDSEGVISSFVATDNREGGRLAARNLARILNEQGDVIVLRFSEGSGSTTNREEGFLEVISNYPGIDVSSDEQYAGATATQAQQVAENLLLRFQDDDGDLTIDGIFTPNESTTYGMLLALRRQRLAGEIAFVGFDATEPLQEGVRNNEISGVVVQNPFNMGYLGVKTIVQVLNGEEIPERIDTGVNFVTAENLDNPDIQLLVNPDIEKWLSLE